MPAETGYKVAVVIVDRHEPLGETATRLLEIAEEKGYGPRVVEAQRGEHDAELSFRVPVDVAEVFNAERSDRWPVPAEGEQDTTPRDTSIPMTAEDRAKIENESQFVPEQGNSGAAINEDAYAADQAKAQHGPLDDEPVDDDGDPNTAPVRKARTAKTKE